MGKVTPISEQFQHFVREVKESFWGDLYGKTRVGWKQFGQQESARARERWVGTEDYERNTEKRRDYRNGYYERDFVTRLGILRLRIARARGKSFWPRGLNRFQRRSEEVLMLIREAFLRGISTRQVGRVVAIFTEEAVSAQTVSKLSRSLDRLVKAFREAKLTDEWVYLFLDGVSLRVRRPAGRKRVQMLVAYGVRQEGSRQLLAFLRSQGESQAAWEGLLQDLYRRGLEGRKLLLIVTDGCPGLAAALQTVYPRVVLKACRRWRKVIETVGAHLTELFAVERMRVHDLWHDQHRLIRKVLAHTMAVFLNLQRVCLFCNDTVDPGFLFLY